ncbi:MAG: hypothetical protein WC682_04900 [Parcubacteria group bacterium]|jgi:hypothetical protein
MKNNIILISIILAIIFGANFIWESAHSFLYMPHYAGFWSFVFIHIKASLGDMLIYVLLYLSGAFVFRNNKWFLTQRKYPYLFLIFMGFCLAIIIENFALKSGRWAYNDLMPIVPIINIGLSPILQLVIIPSAIMKVISTYYRKFIFI